MKVKLLTCKLAISYSFEIACFSSHFVLRARSSHAHNYDYAQGIAVLCITVLL